MCDFKKMKMLQKYSGVVRNSTALKICEKWIIEQLASGLSYNEVTNLFYANLEENGIKVDKKVSNSIYFYIKRYGLENKIKELKEKIRNNEIDVSGINENNEDDENGELKIFKNI